MILKTEIQPRFKPGSSELVRRCYQMSYWSSDVGAEDRWCKSILQFSGWISGRVREYRGSSCSHQWTGQPLHMCHHLTLILTYALDNSILWQSNIFRFCYPTFNNGTLLYDWLTVKFHVPVILRWIQKWGWGSSLHTRRTSQMKYVCYNMLQL